MKIKNKAFTLTELLVAIGIIGAIAAVTIPSLMTRFQNKMFVTKLKGTTQAIKQLADKQRITSITRDLEGSDFKDPADLLSSDNFNIVSSCAPSSTNCWKTTSYKTVNNTSTATVSRPTNIQTARLKDGATIGYIKKADYVGVDYYGQFYIDLNGDDLPNIVGRDYFSFYIKKDGGIVAIPGGTGTAIDDSSLNSCKSGSANVCYGTIMYNGWKMPY